MQISQELLKCSIWCDNLAKWSIRDPHVGRFLFESKKNYPWESMMHRVLNGVYLQKLYTDKYISARRIMLQHGSMHSLWCFQIRPCLCFVNWNVNGDLNMFLYSMHVYNYIHVTLCCGGPFFLEVPRQQRQINAAQSVS
jgi:hypothetical protein